VHVKLARVTCVRGHGLQPKAHAGDANALAEIRHLAHRMAGTGATLGFETLGARAAGIAEQLTEAGRRLREIAH
jgi:hypothetical protein